MLKDRQTGLYALGLAIFAMFFGAGNIIFPLTLGQQTLAQTPYALTGLLLTAVVVPFAGLLAMFLYQGNIPAFFGRLGRQPGLLLAFLIIALLGPFGSTPRCIALAYSTLKLTYPSITPVLFNTIACVCLFLLASRRQRLLSLLGYILTPLLIALLTYIVAKGWWERPTDYLMEAPMEKMEAFWQGLKEGYNTMDLLAAFFFAPVIISLAPSKTQQEMDAKTRFLFVLKASGIGALLLAVVYLGFSYLAAFYATHLEAVSPDQLLAVIAVKVLGPEAGLVVCLIVVLACLTTAIALIAAFSGFVHQELLQGRVKYEWILAISLLITDGVACFEFRGISQFLAPVLEICYPALILLTGINLTEKLLQLRKATPEVN